MTAGFVLPTLLAVVLVCLMGWADWRLRPLLALPVLSAAMLIAASGLLLVVLGAATGFVLGPARSTSLLEWCRVIPLHHQVHPLVGAISLVALAVICWRVGRVLRDRRHAIRSVDTDARISVVDHAIPIAHAVPTKAGCVVVSTGLLSALTPAERRAVFAHERAHLRFGHHRHVLLAELCVAVLPPLRAVANQLRHATERAADEAAAAHVNDRGIVARAIGTVALGSLMVGVPGLGGGSVPRRVEALLFPDRERLAGQRVSSLAVGVAVVAGLAVGLQLHHFVLLIDHLCNGTA